MLNLFSRSILIATILGFGAAGAQTPAKPAGLDLQVQLTSPVKAKKVKVGDTVSAITITPISLAQVVVPAGSKVTGHVRQVEADASDAHTSLIALSFDEVAVKNGQKVPLNSFVRAALMPTAQGLTAQEAQQATNTPVLSPNRGAINGGMGGYLGTGSSGGMMTGTPTANGDPARTASTQTQQQEPPKPTAARTGQVIGLRGVELQVTNPDHLSVFKSDHKNLELDEGLQLMLVVMQ